MYLTQEERYVQDFRRWLQQQPAPYTMYPSTRSILQSLRILYDLLDTLDLSDLGL